MDGPSLADRILAPLTWLERARGWKRRGLAALYLAILLAVAACGRRATCLWSLPDAPEPFDLAKFGRVELADADNAMVAYQDVFARFGHLDAAADRVALALDWQAGDWAAVAPEVRRWAEERRGALDAWIAATDRPDSLLVQPGEFRMQSPIGPSQASRAYARLAILEGSRLEGLGDLEGAWRMYRAALRAGRHDGRHGGEIARLKGYGLLRLATPRVEAWIDRPGQTPGLLRRAIDDVEACLALTSPASEMVRAEYFSAREVANDPATWANLGDSGPYSKTDWVNQIGAFVRARRFLRRDPERSARILRLITAGYLAQCDRPRPLRPRLLFEGPMIFDHDARTPPAVRAIAPGDLDAWYRDSVLRDLGPFSSMMLGLLDAELGTFDRFRLRMAERAFAVERGRPPRTYGELLGPYLKALPEGVEPGDLVNPGSG